jgi:hypothetical protein
LHVALAAGALLLLETALRFAQLTERRAGLPGAAWISDDAARRMASVACRAA